MSSSGATKGTDNMRREPIFRRRRLPHWDFPNATYFITACLEGSIPARGLADLDQFRESLEAKPCPEGLTEEDWETQKLKMLFARFDHWIDDEPAVRYLEDERLAEQVRGSLYHFAGERYDLIAYVIMASHFHWVFRPTREWSEEVYAEDDDRTPRQRIMHSIRSYTAKECNRLLGRTGVFWQVESYDHCVRDDAELQRIIEYVEQNPVKAGLAVKPQEWRSSSAHDRALWGMPIGEVLLPNRGGARAPE